MGQLGRCTTVDRNSKEGRTLWTASCQRLTSMFDPGNAVILHRAFWAAEYVSEGQRLPFSVPQAEDIARQNAYLEFCYQQVEQCLSPAVVAVEPELCVASETHRWGLKPYHYVDEYYWEIWRQIQAALEQG